MISPSDGTAIVMNISISKNGKAKAIRRSTLEAICAAIQCQPGDITRAGVSI